MPNLKDLMGRQPDTYGETYYMVDSDFRTAAQGWVVGDGTGPRSPRGLAQETIRRLGLLVDDGLWPLARGVGLHRTSVVDRQPRRGR